MSLAVRGALASLGKGVGEGQFGQREREVENWGQSGQEREREVGPTRMVRCLACVGGREPARQG